MILDQCVVVEVGGVGLHLIILVVAYFLHLLLFLQGKIVNFCPVFGAGAIPNATMRTKKHWQQLVRLSYFDSGSVCSSGGRWRRPSSHHTSCCQCFLVLMVTWRMAPAPNTGRKFTILPCKNNKRCRKYQLVD